MVKKQIIMQNALELFAKQGFEATSIQQITDKCGISKGAFYLSFKSKDELIFSLLDQFLEDLLINFEQSVTNSKDNSQLLFQYCYVSLKNVETNMDLAQVFIQEASSMINNAIFERLQLFHFVILRTLTTIIQRQYPQLEESLQHELVFTVNALIKSHTEQMLHEQSVDNIELICRAVEEKTTILAAYMSLTTQKLEKQLCATPSKERLLVLIDEKLEQIKTPVEQESLQLLRSHIETPQLSPAMELGIIRNLHATTSSKYVAHMYELYRKSII